MGSNNNWFDDKDLIADFTSNINQRTEELFRIPDMELDEDGCFIAPVVVLRENVVFPRMISPVFVGQKQNLESIRFGLENDQTVITLIPKDEEKENPVRKTDFYPIGLEIAVGRLVNLPEDHFSTLIQGRRRVILMGIVQKKPVLMAKVYVPEETVEETRILTALMRTTRNLFEKCVQLDRKLPDEAHAYSTTITDPSWLADMIATTISLPTEQRREILFELNPTKRLKLLNQFLAQELDVLELGNEISTKVQNEVDKNQREFYLREQLKAIQAELDEEDVFTRELSDLKKKIDEASFSDEARNAAIKEFERLNQMPPMSPEVSVIRGYIDWLLDLPWTVATEDNLNVLHASDVLDQNHYGLTKAKDRILEYIAVRSLKPKKEKQPILCFIGPPGTGKTSIGRSIAEALGKKFVRVSLGGVRDEAEIRGHRRTYVGSMPGRILQTMKKAGTINPLFMLDEIDKLGNDYRGDPSSALLEVLDPEQNDKFSDHYLEVDYDLSHVMFITTANSADSIPDALLDRMEIIEFPGYVEEEKLTIANKYLISRQIDENGLEPADISFDESTIKKLIREYTYEAGVRNLEREIGKVCRKIARLKAEGKNIPAIIHENDLEEFMGPPNFFQSETEKKDEIGVATGLAWTANGGDITTIEVLTFEGKGNLQITGQIGDVMQESAQAALSFIKSKAKQLNLKNDFFEKIDIHVHVPEGAVPKDGPSAGITLAVALISAVTEIPVKKDIAMTGEITLRGHVLPVGGIREKVLAANRIGIKTILIPEKNIKDLVELPEQVRNVLEIIPVNHMDQVIFHTFGTETPKRKESPTRETKKKPEKGNEPVLN
ncbi:MAG: endopeptidase La [Flexilinea flocculi]|jgi:ATP-dependent Lon protease|nr:endopeptidase La [Flexilinea flocculi]